MKRLKMLMLVGILLMLAGPLAAQRDGKTDLVKWSQWVDIATGRDIASTWVTTQPVQKPGQVIADDWRCLDGLPVTDVHWWGSYIEGEPGLPMMFEISIHEDIPDNGCCPSHPGALLHSEIGFVGTDVQEAFFAAADEHDIYQYNYDLLVPFEQVQGEIYWLNIIAIVPSSSDVLWGWHTAIRPAPENGIDAAVRIDDYCLTTGEYTQWGPMYDDLTCSGVQMAFELTTIPEPGSVALVGTALLGAIGIKRRRKLV